MCVGQLFRMFRSIVVYVSLNCCVWMLSAWQWTASDFVDRHTRRVVRMAQLFRMYRSIVVHVSLNCCVCITQLLCVLPGSGRQVNLWTDTREEWYASLHRVLFLHTWEIRAGNDGGGDTKIERYIRNN